jgi:hypothetical protein
VNSTANRTLWPLSGGPLALSLHHKWTYYTINLGLGDGVGDASVTSFNISLTPDLHNATGNGTLCIDRVPLPANLPITEGTNASIQVVTFGQSGSALYNCADITFSSKATEPELEGCTPDAVKVAVLGAGEGTGTGVAAATVTVTTAPTATGTSGAEKVGGRGSIAGAAFMAGVAMVLA